MNARQGPDGGTPAAAGGVDPEARTRRFAVVSRWVVLVACWVLVGLGVLFIVGDAAPVGVALIVVAALLVLARGAWTVVRGARAARAAQAPAAVPDAPVLAPGTASPVDRVVADLVGMNDEALPYLIAATPSPEGVQVEVRWKSEELRWAALFVRGKVAYAWRMELTLDPATSHYRFVEYSGSSSTRAAVGPTGVFARADWTWRRGKTAMQRRATYVEGPDGAVVVSGSGGSRSSWEGSTQIAPGDAKRPVFAVLRQHGWRPRHDWFGARAFES
ncbi:MULTISPECIES: hypothetical protein [unclassified Isoptericola]|uniref:hypothetical protein n=1 Tax=unclassified Isoptericola TaxID=2623355 RepID=UPI0036655AE5